MMPLPLWMLEPISPPDSPPFFQNDDDAVNGTTTNQCSSSVDVKQPTTDQFPALQARPTNTVPIPNSHSEKPHKRRRRYEEEDRRRRYEEKNRKRRCDSSSSSISVSPERVRPATTNLLSSQIDARQPATARFPALPARVSEPPERRRRYEESPERGRRRRYESTSPSVSVSPQRRLKYDSISSGSLSPERVGPVPVASQTTNSDGLEIVEVSPAPNNVVKEVVDVNGDDELVAVAEVSQRPSATSSRTSGREKTKSCKKCSKKFLTNAALRIHQTEHRRDAGGTESTKTFGMPVSLYIGQICRFCQIVFDTHQSYHDHMRRHKIRIRTCRCCSAISTDRAAMKRHQKFVAKKTASFACGTCRVNLPSDHHLMSHLSTVHNQSMFFFCKLCAIGTTKPNTIWSHVSQAHAESDYTIIQRIALVPMQSLTFASSDETALEQRVKNQEILLHKTSVCSHGSMLVDDDTLVACKLCFCCQLWDNYLAHNQLAPDVSFVNACRLPGHLQAFPLMSFLNDENSKQMIAIGNRRIIVN